MNMKFIKGMIMGGMVSAGAMMMYKASSIAEAAEKSEWPD